MMPAMPLVSSTTLRIGSSASMSSAIRIPWVARSRTSYQRAIAACASRPSASRQLSSGRGKSAPALMTNSEGFPAAFAPPPPIIPRGGKQRMVAVAPERGAGRRRARPRPSGWMVAGILQRDDRGDKTKCFLSRLRLGFFLRTFARLIRRAQPRGRRAAQRGTPVESARVPSREASARLSGDGKHRNGLDLDEEIRVGEAPYLDSGAGRQRGAEVVHPHVDVLEEGVDIGGECLGTHEMPRGPCSAGAVAAQSSPSALARERPRPFFARGLWPSAALGGRGTGRSEPLSQLIGGAFVERHVASENHAVKLARGRGRHEAFGDVLPYALGVALQRIAPAAAAAGAHDGLGADRHRNMAAGHGPEIALAGQPQQIAAGLAGRAVPEAPWRTFAALRLLEIPLALDQIAHAHVDAEPAAELAGAAGILPQLPAFDHHRAFKLDAFDRAVAHVALADRDRAGRPVLERPAAPAAALDALHHEAPPGRGMGPEEYHRAAEQAVMTGGHALGHGLGQRPDDGVDHDGHDAAPARHRGREARHHDVAFGDDDLERAERAFVDGIERAGERLVGDARAGKGARIDRGLALG